MKKALRISWLIFAFVVLLPVIIIVELVWLVLCIYITKRMNQSLLRGLQIWLNYLKAGIAMNADFVENGL